MKLIGRWLGRGWGRGIGMGVASLALVACGEDGGGKTAVCDGKLVADGQVCVLGTPITETGFDCPAAMPFEYSGDHGGEPWVMCSSQDDLDAEAIEQAMDEADPSAPNTPGDPHEPGIPGDPTDPNDPNDPDDPSDPGDPNTPSDIDSDRIYDDNDNCPDVFNPDQSDDDGDGTGDACEACWDADGNGECDPPPVSVVVFGSECASSSDCTSGLCVETSSGAYCTAECGTDPGAFVCPATYVCEEVGDSSGGSLAVCLRAADVTPPEDRDTDGDGFYNEDDNCPEAANGDQADADHDGIGDACDDCLDLNSNRICDDDE